MDEGSREASPEADGRRLAFGLSAKLLGLTVVFVMLAEILVYVPSIANFRNTWLRDRVGAANIAAIALGEVADVPRSVQDRLLAATGAMIIAVREGNARRLVAMAQMPPEVARHYDLSDYGPTTAIYDAFDTLIFGEGRVMRVLGAPAGSDRIIELVHPETPLRNAMLRFSINILGLSLVISIITASLVYVTLRWLFLRPMQRLTRAMALFSEDPEDPGRIVAPSRRTDEIGDAERHLAGLQRELIGTLKQKSHLADLGLAVSKINHDLRNMLASAQLITDRLASVPDQTVQRLAPKLVAALDRAIGFSQSVLAYGKAREAPPERRLVALERLVGDTAEMLGLSGHAAIRLEIAIPQDLEIDADPDHLLRVLMNLMRNAMQALDGDADAALVRRIRVEAERQGSVVTIRVSDTGPGVPPRARENLFRAFQGGVRRGGTGLGLAICAELVRGHGGTIELDETGPGAHFRIRIPDRVIELRSAGRKANRG
ncbi:sensor histidine kinase [Prosthecomicrobium hirschii]|uniref:histidine kinase n=1 Tax=Prosthecodimorpha hirschii TaxID=665126 RepID=A0A0P6WGH7_9HYPH|nr:HAMP domain-containing sensor histidine kinase [Prosthecomicrobium hirschii]KPL53794.1 histidine kinase [Prosthecomicrobium hirschii]MCW1841314.1 HAMP domain-containing histidine kinase [Prosthecomicrobium hirschii]